MENPADSQDLSPSTQPARPQPRGTFSWTDVWAAVGGVAGAVAFVYVIGGAVEALRLNHAGLPVEQSIAVVPKATLLAVAIDAIFLPAVVQAAINILIFLYLKNWGERLTHPTAVERRQSKAARRAASPSPLRRFIRWSRSVLGCAFRRISSHSMGLRVREPLRRWVRPPVLWFLGRIVLRPWFPWALILIFLPWTGTTLILYVSVTVQFRVYPALYRRADAGLISRRLELVAVGVISAIAIFASSLGDEVVYPGRLPTATVDLSNQTTRIRGNYVGTSSENVYLGVDKHLVGIPQHLIARVSVTRPKRRPPENGKSLLRRLGN
jgi:hypothetical protein